MSTIRVGRRRKFTVISRDALNDDRLSFRARGVLAWLLDKPDDWQVKAEDIANNGKEGRDAVRSALAELEAAGYLKRRKFRGDDGRWTSEQVLYEAPQETSAGNPPWETSDGEPAQESQALKAEDCNRNTGTEDCLVGDADDDTQRSGSDVVNPEAVRLCELLADLIEANGSKRPTVTAKWLAEADLMLRRDEREPERAEKLIRWCQADPFWRSNVLSMPKFRAKYDQLRLRANEEAAKARRPTAAELRPMDRHMLTDRTRPTGRISL